MSEVKMRKSIMIKDTELKEKFDYLKGEKTCEVFLKELIDFYIKYKDNIESSPKNENLTENLPDNFVKIKDDIYDLDNETLNSYSEYLENKSNFAFDNNFASNAIKSHCKRIIGMLGKKNARGKENDRGLMCENKIKNAYKEIILQIKKGFYNPKKGYIPISKVRNYCDGDLSSVKHFFAVNQLEYPLELDKINFDNYSE